MPVELEVAVDGRLPEPAEVTAYYVVSESLANAQKYAQASRVRVSATRRDGALEVEVVDDGVGGAQADGGSGLRGLADRLDAVGGRLEVSSPVGGGTRIAAGIPC
jgi:signal transduction histidine kinase